ncbi:MAG: hypothetical protein VB124_01200 [Burkholderia sp.]
MQQRPTTPQKPELLTGVLDWLLGINVNRSLARPIYATTPHADEVERGYQPSVGGTKPVA